MNGRPTDIPDEDGLDKGKVAELFDDHGKTVETFPIEEHSGDIWFDGL